MKSVNRSESVGASSAHPHLGVLFYRGRRLVDEFVLERFAAAGHDQIRAAHGAVFSYMPARGARLTELARRARITKQSMGELVRDLETLGYVERISDPTDGRAQVIRYTDKGRDADGIGVEAIREIERRWSMEVGDERMAVLRAVLEEITGRGGSGTAEGSKEESQGVG
jgi:DNA-binding MarR family transcriptional regulator